MTMVSESAGSSPYDPLDPGGASELVQALRAMGPTLEASARRAEEERTLPEDLVQRFRDMGLFWLKTPEELGGRPLHPLAFSDVVELVAYYDASAAWATMIGCGSTGSAAGWLPDEGAAEVFSPADMPVLAGQPHPRGRAVATDGGYLVSGRWGFASGIHHSNWVLGGMKVEGLEEGAPGRDLVFVAEKSSATVYDNWHVAGLQGTGSSDFSLEEVFVPDRRTYDRRFGTKRRGGPLFRQEGLLFVGNEVPAVCVGLATRAIDDMISLAPQTSRFMGGSSLVDRAVFHKEIGVAKTRVEAARLFYRDAVGAAFDAACAGGPVPVEIQRSALVAQTYVSETCVDVVSNLFRYGGGRALSLSNSMQRHLRNLFAARQHLAATEEHYETVGRALVEEWPRR